MTEREQPINSLIEREVRECQQKQQFPDEMQLADFVLLLDNPEMLPILRRIITEILQSNGRSYKSEYEGTNTTPEIGKNYKYSIVASPNNAQLRGLLLQPTRPNLRHEALALAHTWDKTVATQLAELITYVSSKLGLHINRDAAEGKVKDGDYHLLVSYLRQHLDELRAAFLTEPQSLQEVMQRVRRGTEVEIDSRVAARIVAQLEFILGQINLDDLNLSKKKLAEPDKVEIEPENLHTVVKKFKALFIDADFSKNLTPILKEYGLSPEDITPEVLSTLRQIFASVELILLATLDSTGGPLRNTLYSLLGTENQQPLDPDIVEDGLSRYVREAWKKPEDRNHRNLEFTTITGEGVLVYKEILNTIATRLTAHDPRSAGVAEVLYKQVLLSENPEEKTVLTKLMHFCNQLVSPQLGQDHDLKSLVTINE